MNRILLSATAMIGLFLAGCSSKPTPPAAEAPKPAAEAPAAPAEPTHAMIGEVQEVDPKGGSLTIRTSDGQLHRVEVASETEVKPLQEGTSGSGKGAAGMANAAGSQVVKGTKVAVKFTEKEGKLVAHEVVHASKQVLKTSEVIIHKVADGGKKVIVKTKDGSEQIYEVSKDFTVTAGRKIAATGSEAGAKINEGAKATLHATEESGKKVVHFVSH